MFENQGYRVDKVRVYHNLSKEQFLKVLNYSSKSSYDAIIRGEKNVSKKIMESLKNKWSNINVDWLFTGHGSMFLDIDYQPEIESNVDSDSISIGMQRLRQEKQYLALQVEMLTKQVNLQNITIRQTDRLLRIVEKLTGVNVESERGYDNQDLRNEAAQLELDVSKKTS